MPTGLWVELDTPVETVGKFLGFARAVIPAALPRLKQALPELLRTHVPVLAPLLALEPNFDLSKLVATWLQKRIGFINLPAGIANQAVAALEAHVPREDSTETA